MANYGNSASNLEWLTLLRQLRPASRLKLLDFIESIDRRQGNANIFRHTGIGFPKQVLKTISYKISVMDQLLQRKVLNFALLLGNSDRRRLQYTNRMISGWLPTPWKIVREALKLAEPTPNDILYDLGCGDGRVVVQAALGYGCRSIGFELDPKRVQQTQSRINRTGVSEIAEVRQRDMLSISDLDKATIIFLYLPQPAINRIRPVLLNDCLRGTKVISVSTWFYGWPTEKELAIRVGSIKWYIGLWYV